MQKFVACLYFIVDILVFMKAEMLLFRLTILVQTKIFWGALLLSNISLLFL